MKKILLFFFALSIFFAAAQQNISSSFVYQDSIRAFKTYIPQKYIDNPTVEVPLLLNLHGYGSENWQQEIYGDFRSIADENNFIICHPNGTFDAFGSRFWNVGFAPSSIDDVGFLSALIDSIALKYNINTEKIFSTGMSNGGYMSYKLACELPNKIKAIASVTGSMTTGQLAICSNPTAIPVMQIHGTNDPTVLYGGNGASLGIEELVGLWVNNNGCDSVAIETSIPDVNTTDNSTATRYDFNSNCSETPVVFYKIENGTHTWPGSVFLIPGTVTNLDFNASAVIWKFFCPEDYVSIQNFAKEEDIQVYPNPSNKFLQIKLLENENLEIVQVFNEMGMLVSEQNDTTINVSDLSKGFYYLKIKTDLGFYSKRIAKEY